MDILLKEQLQAFVEYLIKTQIIDVVTKFVKFWLIYRCCHIVEYILLSVIVVGVGVVWHMLIAKELKDGKDLLVTKNIV